MYGKCTLCAAHTVHTGLDVPLEHDLRYRPSWTGHVYVDICNYSRANNFFMVQASAPIRNKPDKCRIVLLALLLCPASLLWCCGRGGYVVSFILVLSWFSLGSSRLMDPLHLPSRRT